jgi:thymidylate kinase
MQKNEKKNKKQVVIFDGPDGCGKTTIAKEFVKRHREFSYFKNKPTKKRIKKCTNEQLALIHLTEIELFLSFIKQLNCQLIVDRSYPSEIVYNRSLNRNANDKYLMKLDREHAKENVKIIICVKNNELLNDRLDNIFDNQTLRTIKKEYLKFAKQTKCKVLVMNTTNENLENQIKKIKKFIYEDRNI